MNKKPMILLSASEVSERWGGRPTAKTILNWQYAKPVKGPRPKKIGGLVMYPLKEVERYERSR